ncbi:group II intron maturase-specific domain-containing protein [Vreelandella rituensis]
MKTDLGANTVTHPEGQGQYPESRPVSVETIPASSSRTKAEPAPLMEAVVEKANMARAYRRELVPVLRGWASYFSLVDVKRPLEALDGWVRPPQRANLR